MARKRKTDFEYTADGNGEVSAGKLMRDTFPTERRIVTAAIDALCLPFAADDPLRVLDAGAGDSGIWGRVFKERYPHSVLHGIEVRPVPPPAQYDDWFTGDFLTFSGSYDVIIGNIPFSLAESFIPHALSLLNPNGKIIFLLRAQFNGGQDRYKDFWARCPLEAEYYCASRMPFISRRNKKTGRLEPASDVWDYSLFQFSNEWKESWWTCRRWDYKTNPSQRSFFDA